MSPTAIEPGLLAVLGDVAAGESCELLHAEYRGGVLRLVLDHPDGITLDHCERVSRQASALLDTEDFGSRRYLLEVSSPGLDRQLYRPQDYERFVGRGVRVTFNERDGGRKTISGRLEAFDASAGGTATVQADDAGGLFVIPLADIKQAKLKLEV